ncbi:P-loop NTPase fold protein [Psychrobacter sp. B38]|uniref:KAP family P-loop NTPase fold protein n=1 Tax=Psychrobacter sp. B38 TaxID=3143538 RepID=UPI0032104225
MTDNQSFIHQDKPISSKADDFLGRNYFSENLAKSILSWKHKESWVVALTGKWGSGKTSIKNLVIQHINDKNKDMIILDFSPWEWSSQDLITQAFFDELEKKLIIKNRKIALDFVDYKNFTLKKSNVRNLKFLDLKKLKKIKNLPLNIIKIILLSLHNISTVLYEPIIKLLPVFGTGILISPIIDDSLKKHFLYVFLSLFILGSISNIYQYFYAKTNSLRDNKNNLSKSLINIKHPILIIFDDLDRLNKSQLESLMQLIKSNLDFNNLIFFLLYSKEVVEKKLTDSSQKGVDYLQKIIQYEVATPVIESFELRQVIVNNFDMFMNTLNIKNKKDIANPEDFQRIINGVLNYLIDMRAIYRFFNSYRFNLASLINNNHLEVNAIDFMALETIRLFEPELFESIKSNGSFLTGQPYFERTGRIAESNEVKEEIDSFKERNISLKNATLLEYMFPILTDYSDRTALKNLKISSAEKFDNYFIYSTSKTKISSYDTELIKNNLTSDTNSVTIIDNYFSSTKRTSLLAQIYMLAKEFNNIEKSNLVVALSHLFQKTNNTLSISSERQNLLVLVENIIGSIDNVDIKITTFDNLNHADIHPYVIIFLINSLEKYKYGLSDVQISEIIQSTLNKIEYYIRVDYDKFITDEYSKSMYLFFQKHNPKYAKAFFTVQLNDERTFKKTLSIFIGDFGPFESESIDASSLFKIIKEAEFKKLLDKSLIRNPNDELLNNVSHLYSKRRFS